MRGWPKASKSSAEFPHPSENPRPHQFHPEAGEKLFNHPKAAPAAATPDIDALNATAGQAVSTSPPKA
jgi:hypothetical protein